MCFVAVHAAYIFKIQNPPVSGKALPPVHHSMLMTEKHVPMQVLQVIDDEAVPLLRRCSLSGNADLLTHNALFSQQPLAVDMLIDILTDRGFFVAHVAEEQVFELQPRLLVLQSRLSGLCIMRSLHLQCLKSQC